MEELCKILTIIVAGGLIAVLLWPLLCPLLIAIGFSSSVAATISWSFGMAVLFGIGRELEELLAICNQTGACDKYSKPYEHINHLFLSSNMTYKSI